MKILCSSDFHGVKPVQMKSIIKNNKIDAILSGGDYSPHGWGGEGDSEEGPLKFLTKLGVPVFSVFGNIDQDKDFFEDFDSNNRNFNFIHLKKVRIKDYYVLGIGDFYLDSFALKKFEKLLKEKPDKTIVLSHYPPEGAVDITDFGMHVGSKELRDLVEKYKPPLFVCGHIHEAAGIENIGKTIVVNVAMRNVLIEIEKDEINVSLV